VAGGRCGRRVTNYGSRSCLVQLDTLRLGAVAAGLSRDRPWAVVRWLHSVEAAVIKAEVFRHWGAAIAACCSVYVRPSSRSERLHAVR